MKAVLTAERPAGEEWTFERKLDGIRMLAFRDRGRVRLLSRNKLSLTESYPKVAASYRLPWLPSMVVEFKLRAAYG